MYELYIANKNYSSWSLRPWVLMRELAIPFEERLVQFAPGAPGASRDTFREFSPTGQVPCLHDNGTIIWESLGIVEYLAERHPAVWPEDSAARSWARSAAAEMHAGFGPLRTHCLMSCGVRLRLRETPPDLKRDLARLDELWIDGLRRFGGPFLAGDRFTAADAFFAPVAFRIQSYGLDVAPDAAAYAQRLLALHGMQRWYADAIAETWREPEHEREMEQSCVVLEDFRAH